MMWLLITVYLVGLVVSWYLNTRVWEWDDRDTNFAITWCVFGWPLALVVVIFCLPLFMIIYPFVYLAEVFEDHQRELKIKRNTK